MPRKPRTGSILEAAGGDEAKAAAVQRIIGMCGFDYLLWIESEADLWARVTAPPTLSDPDKTVRAIKGDEVLTADSAVSTEREAAQ